MTVTRPHTHLYVQSIDSEDLFGEFQKWESGSRYSHNWSLPERAVTNVLSSRNCCSGQITGRVTAGDDQYTRLRQEVFSVDVGICEMVCGVSVTTFQNVEASIKAAAARVVAQERRIVDKKNFHIGNLPPLPTNRDPARPQVNDLITKSNDPTPSTTARDRDPPTAGGGASATSHSAGQRETTHLGGGGVGSDYQTI